MTQPTEPGENHGVSHDDAEALVGGARPAFRWAGAAPHPAVVTGPDANDFFFGQALHTVARLCDHIQRLDSGITYAVDDVAVVMRAMLSNKNGNRVLLRMHKTIAAAPIEILLTRPPVQSKDVVFSVGSIPATTEAVLAEGGRWVWLEDWPKQPVITARVNGGTQTWDWSTFIDRYTNQWGGAHLDKKVASLLRYIDTFAVGGYSLSSYLMRTAAVQTWYAAQALLRDWTRTVPALRAMRADMPPEIADGMGSFYMSGAGGNSTPPVDRRPLGELHYFAHRQGVAEYQSFMTGERSTDMTLGFGRLAYTLTTTPDGIETPEESPAINQPRAPAAPMEPLVANGTVALKGRTLKFPPDEAPFLLT